MTVKLVYCFPQLNADVYGPAARRFADSYMSSPPGECDHEIIVGLNGGTGIGPYQKSAFNPLPVRFVQYSNFGRDLGLFQYCAEAIEADFFVFFGAFVHFHAPGWLDLLVRAYEDHGPAMFGPFAFHQPAIHIRTTAFAMPRQLFGAYPVQIGDKDRYGAEHGPNSFTLWTRKMGFSTLQVTRRGVFDVPDWHHVDRSEMLLCDQHSDRAGI